MGAFGGSIGCISVVRSYTITALSLSRNAVAHGLEDSFREIPQQQSGQIELRNQRTLELGVHLLRTLQLRRPLPP
jgi:hypothetical protein